MTGVETTKLTPSLRWEAQKWSVQRNFLLDPGKSPVPLFYDISRAGMHPGEPENRQVWPNGDSAAGVPVRLPAARNLLSLAGRLSLAGSE
jgi:hypothetical protein